MDHASKADATDSTGPGPDGGDPRGVRDVDRRVESNNSSTSYRSLSRSNDSDSDSDSCSDPMDAHTIEREVQRLQPWYYRWDLRGVLTDRTPPCDATGHRQIYFPPVEPGFWHGKTILDVACNEGAWSFGALAHGAARAEGFDCRAANVDKARFVAKVLGQRGATFRVASTDSWLRTSDSTFDWVFLCGIIYHVAEPWQLIADYCARAREGLLVTCVLHGGDGEGYARWTEGENIAASENALPSLMPHDTRTLLAEFRRHGFHPVRIAEQRGGVFWGACTLLLQRVPDEPAERAPRIGQARGPAADALDLHLVPVPVREPGERERPCDLVLCVYNRLPQRRPLLASVRAVDAAGSVVHAEGPQRIELEARTTRERADTSEAFWHRLRLDLAAARGAVRVEATLQEPQGDALLVSTDVTLG